MVASCNGSSKSIRLYFLDLARNLWRIKVLHKTATIGLILLLMVWCAGCPSVPERNGNDIRDSEKQTDPPPEFKYSTYYVQKNDTLYSIARAKDVNVKTLVDLNSSNPENLRVGQLLLIPQSESAKRDGRIGGSNDDGPPAQRLSPAWEQLDDQSLHRGRPGSRFWWPTKGTIIRKFGDRIDGFTEPGMGILAPRGTSVHSIADGKVLCAISRSKEGWGNVIAIEHSNNFVSWYGSLAEIDVNSGDQVSQGEKIGTIGRTHKVRFPQLAFRIFRDERPVDPMNYLKR